MLISTGVDALIKLVREKGKIEITLASRLLNIPISTIEEWTHALEEEGIISIEYQLTKIHLRWISPGEEKIEEERAAFEKEKDGLLQQIKGADRVSQEQMKEVQALKDDFNANYSKIMAAIEELGKKGAGTHKAKTIGEGDYYKAVDALEELKGKINELRDSIKFMREQLEKTRSELMGSDIEKKLQSVIKSKTSVSGMKAELEAMEKEVSQALASLSSEKIDVPALERSLHGYQKEFSLLKNGIEGEIGALREASSLAEHAGSAKKDIGELRASANSLSEEMKGLRGSVSEMESRLSQISESVRENFSKAGRMNESLKNAEDVLARVHGSGEAQEKMKALTVEKEALEKKVEKLNASVQEALPLFENVDKLISSLSELRKKVAEERKRLAEESGAIFASLDEEISTYSTFQKIKEKASHTISEYLSQLEKIDVNYEKISEESERAGKKLDEAMAKFRESGEYKAMEKISAEMEALTQKKQLLEQIKGGVDALDAQASRAAKGVKLLAKEAEIIELRAPTPAGETRGHLKRVGDEVKESVSLSETEQKEFDAKRDELRKLIKKLWEEE